MLCPRCGKPMALVNYTDWDNLVTHYYPQCHNCGYTTRRVFESPDSLRNYMETRFPELRNE